MEGIWDALTKNGIEPVAEVTCDRWELEHGYNATVKLLERGVPIRAIVALNDRIAFGACRALGERGLSVPDDVSFDDDVISTFLKPMLTTVAICYCDMGYRAVQLLLHEDTSSGDHLVRMPIRERGSVGALPN